MSVEKSLRKRRYHGDLATEILARQAGWQIDEMTVQLAQGQAQGITGGTTPASGVGPAPGAPRNPNHPGMQEQTENINQHVVDESGARSGPKAVM